MNTLDTINLKLYYVLYEFKMLSILYSISSINENSNKEKKYKEYENIMKRIYEIHTPRLFKNLTIGSMYMYPKCLKTFDSYNNEITLSKDLFTVETGEDTKTQYTKAVVLIKNFRGILMKALFPNLYKTDSKFTKTIKIPTDFYELRQYYKNFDADVAREVINKNSESFGKYAKNMILSCKIEIKM